MITRFNHKEVNAVRNVIENGKYLSGFTTKFGGGEEVKKFEDKFAKYIGTKYALSVNSGTTALLIAYQTAIQHGKITKNRKLINPTCHMPAYTFTADPSAAMMAGGKIVFEDIDKESYCMIAPKKPVPIAVPTFLLGNAPKKINYNKADFIIEDCCQALGTKVSGKIVGSKGSMSIFSFQETKHITTLGEGGMICSNNKNLIEIAASIRNHAEYYLQKNYLGGNYRMTEAQAAFGTVQLSKINSILNEFRKNAKKVINKLPNGIEPPIISSKVDHSFLLIGCMFNEKIIGVTRDKFLKKLTKNRMYILKGDEKSDIKGINMKSGKLISAGYSMPLYDIPMFKKFKPKGGCKNTEEIIKKSIWMDIHKFRTQNEISQELDILQDTVRECQR